MIQPSTFHPVSLSDNLVSGTFIVRLSTRTPHKQKDNTLLVTVHVMNGVQMAFKIMKNKPFVIDGSLVSGFTAPWASNEANLRPYSQRLTGHGSKVRKL